MPRVREVVLKDGSRIKIRRVRVEDLGEIYRIEKASFKDPYPPDLLYTLAILHNETFLVAEQNGKVVGYVIATIRWDVVGHILNIAVHPERRRLGIGRALMEAVMEELRRLGARVFRLEVRVSNEPARRLYEELGFRVRDRLPNYYSDGEDAYVMLREAD